jgi:hypothetical protein
MARHRKSPVTRLDAWRYRASARVSAVTARADDWGARHRGAVRKPVLAW